MSYTFIIMRKDRTDVRPVTLHLSWARLWSMIFVVIALPVIGFWISYTIIAPRVLGVDVEDMQNAKDYAEKKLAPVLQENARLKLENQKLTENIMEERDLRAGIEARITISETARIEATNRLSDVDSELISLRKSVRFYKELMKPKAEQDTMQCFNIKANVKSGKLFYGVNFLKSDTKSKTNIVVEFRILSGDTAVDIDRNRVDVAAALHSRKISLAKDYRLTGSFKVSGLAQGLRILDIKAVNGKKETLAHCWKAF